jgi:hypothetical protein
MTVGLAMCFRPAVEAVTPNAAGESFPFGPTAYID